MLKTLIRHNSSSRGSSLLRFQDILANACLRLLPPPRAVPRKSNRCPLDDADSLTTQQKLEQKRLEHEKQRALQKKAFEEQVSLRSCAVLGDVVKTGRWAESVIEVVRRRRLLAPRAWRKSLQALHDTVLTEFPVAVNSCQPASDAYQNFPAPTVPLLNVSRTPPTNRANR